MTDASDSGYETVSGNFRPPGDDEDAEETGAADAAGSAGEGAPSADGADGADVGQPAAEAPGTRPEPTPVGHGVVQDNVTDPGVQATHQVAPGGEVLRTSTHGAEEAGGDGDAETD